MVELDQTKGKKTEGHSQETKGTRKGNRPKGIIVDHQTTTASESVIKELRERRRET